MASQICGLDSCNRNVFPMARYPNYVCQDCLDESPPVDCNGNAISFYNEGIDGGFESVIDNNGTKIKGSQNKCFVKGEACRAQEARFGGIVITPISTGQ